MNEGAPQNENKMDLEESQEEANLLRAKMSESLGHEPTAEDYDEALQAVEELKKLAEEEPSSQKILNIFGRFSVETASVVVGILHDTFTKKPETYEEVLKQSESISSKILDHKKQFEDASYQLQELKRKAEKQQG